MDKVIRIEKAGLVVNLAFLLLLSGFLYLLVFGGLSYIKREGLSLQFALEAAGMTLLFSALNFFLRVDINPVLFLIILYLVTMRARLLVDAGNTLAQRGNYALAGRLYELALAIFPDETNRLMVKINQAVSLIRQDHPDEGIASIQEVLKQLQGGHLGIKTEVACYYNLAIAYRRKGLEKQALDYFKKVVDTWPVSIYGRRAVAELRRNNVEIK